MSEPKFTNRLINEKSPYLLQHAHNPVDWYSWGPEAFEKAKSEDKPIFLSIGYSTCHWCHVMERESFEDLEVAEVLNRDFVSIKVDREERPDLDHIYMSFCQALTGHGGWPLSVFLSPDKKPFFAGTYFPKESRGGMPGFITILNGISRAWKTQREELLRQGQSVLQHISRSEVIQTGNTVTREDVSRAYRILRRNFDQEYGGFSRAPKFPTPHLLSFLLRYGVLNNEELAIEIAVKTLDGMYRGGIYDHIGGGFSRYSTDEKWLVPHFEKMLYDNALLLIAYCEAYQLLRREEHRTVVEEVAAYIMREMTAPEGGFYSAEDADSEGVEGKYYLWTPAEVLGVLGEENGREFCELYDITETGNFEGKSIPNLIKTPRERVKARMHALAGARQKLLQSRSNRIHPHKDDKILTSWNGLMIAALAKASRVLENTACIRAAEKAMNFILSRLWRSDGRLMARYREGEAAYPAYADDYAFVVWALLELYEATFNSDYLRLALELNRDLLRLFWDDREGGLFFYGSDVEEEILRPKEIYDGATPSANSITAMNFLRLSRMTGSPELEEKASQVLSTFASTVKQYPAGYTALLTAAMYLLYPSREVIVVGERDNHEVKKMLDLTNATFLPNSVVMFRPVPGDGITKLNFRLSEYESLDGKATAYVCQDYACQAPVVSTSDLKKLIEPPMVSREPSP
ncbi:MAG: thioredoxin domain-containing protein [Syntrophomonadales bacterium]|jgi:uncharacterized protein YyaL (SSP411 family)